MGSYTRLPSSCWDIGQLCGRSVGRHNVYNLDLAYNVGSATVYGVSSLQVKRKCVLSSSYPTISFCYDSAAAAAAAGDIHAQHHFLFSLQLGPLHYQWPSRRSHLTVDLYCLHRSNERGGNSTTSRTRLRSLSSKESRSDDWGESSKGGGLLGQRKQASPTTNSTALRFRLNCFPSPLSLAPHDSSSPPSLPGIIGGSNRKQGFTKRRHSPLHQPNYYSSQNPPQLQQQQPLLPPPPQVYNISKNDFRSIVQQLTGTPSRDSSPAAAAANSRPQHRPPQPRPSSSRLQKIRPPPLAPIARPPHPPLRPVAAAVQPPPRYPPLVPYRNPNSKLPPVPIPHPNSNPSSSFPRPPPSAGAAWAESPVSAYMRYLESSLLGSDTSRLPQPQPLMPPLPSPGLLPSPLPLLLPSPRGITNSSSLPLPPTPSASPLPLPSPGAFLNLSPYPLFSPGFLYPPLPTPNFAFSPLVQSGILGAGRQPPPSPPGFLFPQSPSGFLPIPSPRWRDML
ncbi:hypothetical protein BHM03_00060793 [Ensete ventricosum]|nr:hypothetical protein BHM03_00060793 [Ensete ventricosum]